MDEFLLWEGKANLKVGIIKLAGNLKITNKKIEFTSLSRKIEIAMNAVKNVEIAKKFIRRIKIETKEKQYLFFVPHPENVVSLIKRFSTK